MYGGKKVKVFYIEKNIAKSFCFHYTNGCHNVWVIAATPTL